MSPTSFNDGVLKDQIIAYPSGMEVPDVTSFNDGVLKDHIISYSSGTLWTATTMSRPAAAVAQAKWASGACITHDDRGEMILDLYLQRALCAFMQPADFAHEFGHYDPALACRVTGCLLEYYDDDELDALSVMQFYTTCDELIGAIRHLQYQAVSDAFRVDTMGRAAAIFQEYLPFTLNSWPQSTHVDGGAQGADGNCAFMQFVGSRDIPTAFVEPRDFYNNKGIEIWTHSPNCPSLGDLAEFSDFSRLKLDCNEHVSDGNMFP